MSIREKLIGNIVKSHKTHLFTGKIRNLKGNTFKVHKAHLRPVRLENIKCEMADQ